MNEEIQVPLQAFDKDPIDFAFFFGEDDLYGWQQEAIRKVWHGDRLAMVCANSVGKTRRVIANLGLAIMARYPGSTVVSTSGSWNQIDTQLWPTLKNKVAPIRGWTWNKKEVTAPPVVIDGVTLQSKWVPFSTDDPKRAEGHHDDEVKGKSGKMIPLRVAYFIDEAKGVDDGIFEAMSRCRVSFKCVMSSPGEDKGAFYQCFHKHKSLWDQMIVDWLMCPHLCNNPIERSKIEADIRVKGRDHPLIKSQYFAEFFQGKGYRVYDIVDVQRAMSGMVPKVGYDRAGAFDWSAGGNEQVWGVREGNTILEPFKVFHEKDDMKLARTLIKEFERWKLAPREITMDCGGGGKVFLKILEDMGWHGIRAYANNEPALDRTQYANRYTEDAFEKVSYQLGSLSIPHDDVLERQLREREYIMPNDDSNKRRLQPKEEIRRHGKESPDRLDVLIMLFSNSRRVQLMERDERGNLRRTPQIKDCFRNPDEDRETSMGGGWRGDVY